MAGISISVRCNLKREDGETVNNDRLREILDDTKDIIEERLIANGFLPLDVELIDYSITGEIF